MKTAEVAIEHVLTGVLALCAFILPLLNGAILTPEFLKSEVLVGVLGLAYLFGIVFDKVADTLLGPMEHRLRLCQAIKNLKKYKLHYDGDPFPQDALEFSLRGGDSGRVEWMDSLRSRIRTSRGLAVLGLPAAMGIAIYLSFIGSRGAAQSERGWLPYLPVLANFLVMFSHFLLSHHKRFKPIYKTKDLDFDETERMDQMKKDLKQMRRGTVFYGIVVITSATTLGVIALSPSAHYAFVSIWICGVAITVLSLCVWCRITRTYMEFLNNQLSDLIREARVKR
jgi:hypothetical protein